jgi:hypothetical protein
MARMDQSQPVWFPSRQKIRQHDYKTSPNKVRDDYSTVRPKRRLTEMSANTLSLIAGTLLSLGFSYIPGLRELFDNVEPTEKRLVMLGLLLVTAVAVQIMACLGWGELWGLGLTCDRAGIAGLIEQLVIAIIANQSVYAISPRWTRLDPAGRL